MSRKIAQNRKNSLNLTVLEDRLTPAVNFQFDYSLDSTGFFADASHRAALERAGSELASRLQGGLSAITPGGTANWSAVIDHPVNGSEVRLNNLTIPQDTLLVFVGGSATPTVEAGEGGPGGWSASGTRAFQDLVARRGQAGFGPWGGSVTFDMSKNWYFGADANGAAGRLDFQTVATHELGHVLGIGTAPQWFDQIQGNKFVGANATTVFGSNPTVSADGGHFAQNTQSGGPVSLQPTVANGRVGFSNLDYAALADLGWKVAGINAGAVTQPVDAQAPGAPINLVAAGTVATKLTVVSGMDDGSIQVFTPGADGRLVPVGGALKPFGSGYNGVVRAITADVNGDGTTDIIVGTGAGSTARIRVLDGKTFQMMAPEFVAFESSFQGGVFLAAGDFNGDGKAEIVVTPDQGGGARVRILEVGNNSLNVKADFLGINDPNFRGGARTAVGDINKDGIPDLVVAAGFGGGPRVSILDGASVLTNGRRNLAPDFFAFETTLRNGTYVTVGDADGDGNGDLTFGAGPGGGPRVMTLSGKTLLANGPQAALNKPLANGFAGDPNQRGGVRVSAKDFDGNGISEVVTGSGTGNQVNILKSASTTTSSSLSPFASANLDGVYVG